MYLATTRRLSELFVCSLAILTAFATRSHGQPDTQDLLLRNPKLSESAYLSAAEIQAKHQWELERGIRFPKLVRGNPGRKEIALTFDDGPHPGRTERLLEILRQENVPATFFVVGKLVDKYPELVRLEALEGHEIANHTYDHVRLPTIPPDLIEVELRNGNDAIRRALGVPCRFFRPPGGEYDPDVVKAVKRLGVVMVLWTDDPADFAQPGTSIIEQRVLRRVSNGGILLLHDGVPQTLDILPDLIHKLKAKGYKFVTCSQLARSGGVIKQGGPRIFPKEISRVRARKPLS